FALLLHASVPGELPLRIGPCLFRGIPPGQFVEVRGMSPNLGGYTEAYAAAPHLRKTDRVVPPIDAIPGVAGGSLDMLPASNSFHRPSQIAIKRLGVHRQVQMHVEDQRRA